MIERPARWRPGRLRRRRRARSSLPGAGRRRDRHQRRPAVGARPPRPARPLGAPRCRRVPGWPCRCRATSARRPHRALRDGAPRAGRARRTWPARTRWTTRPDTPALLTAAGCDGRRLGDHLPAPAAGDAAEHPVLRWMEGTALRPVRARAATRIRGGPVPGELAGAAGADYPARDGHVRVPVPPRSSSWPRPAR